MADTEAPVVELTEEQKAAALMPQEAEPEKSDEAQTQATVEAEPAETQAEAAVEQPKPGTPDKALQKVQQDLGVALRKIEELTSRIAESQVAPTKVEQQQVQHAKRKAEALREKLKSNQFNVVDDDVLMAESLSEQDEMTQALAAKVAALESQIETHNASKVWNEVRAVYPKVEAETLNGIWEKAVQDAAETIGVDAEPVRIRNLANRWFHERAGAVNQAALAKPKTPTAPAVAPPGSARVTSERGAKPGVPVNPDQEFVADAMAALFPKK